MTAAISRFVGLGAASLVNMGMLTIASLVIARHVSIEEYGAIRTLSAYSVVFTVVTGLTLHDAVAGRLARMSGSDHSRVVTTGLLLSAISAIASALVLIGFAAITPVFKGVIQHGAIALAVFIPFAVLTVVLTSAMQVTAPINHLALSTAISGALVLIAFYLGAKAGGYYGWLAARGVSWVLIFSITLIIFLKSCRIKWRSFSLEVAREFFVFSRLQFVSAILSLLIMSADVIVVERLSGLKEAGYFGMAALFTRSSHVVATVVGRVYFHELGRRRRKVVYEYLLVTLLTGVAAAIGVYLVAPSLIGALFFGEYGASIPIMNLLVIGLPFSFVAHAVSNVNIASGRSSHAALLSLVSAASMVTLLVIFVPDRGGVGGAIAVAISQFVVAMVGVLLISRRDDLVMSTPAGEERV